MAASTFTFQGSFSAKPAFGAPSGFPSLYTPIAEQMVLSNMLAAQYLLDADGAVTVEFGTLTEAHFVYVTAVGGSVVVTVTSDAGAAQELPCDPSLHISSTSTPVTAMTLTRDPGVETTVEIFLGQRAG